jgi:hypothetical protein
VFQGERIGEFISTILDQVKTQGSIGGEIPHFAEKSAAHIFEDSRSAKFWQSPDLNLESIKLRLAKNGVSNTYKLCILNPVTPAVSARFSKWCGPQVQLSLGEMENVVELLKM